MSNSQDRKPRGTPAGGQFAGKVHSEAAELALDGFDVVCDNCLEVVPARDFLEHDLQCTDGPVEGSCVECGELAFRTGDGISHHYGDGPDGIDHDADGDHVPVVEEDEPDSGGVDPHPHGPRRSRVDYLVSEARRTGSFEGEDLTDHADELVEAVRELREVSENYWSPELEDAVERYERDRPGPSEAGGYHSRLVEAAALVAARADRYDLDDVFFGEDHCEHCAASLDDGAGWDGYCGSCADLIYSHEDEGHDPAREGCPTCISGG